ncbi:MAG: citryl-CoA lyase [Armatimonadota bacterium]|nr:citryl-CoA lyase [Armatimonadota bacterium]
MTEPVFRTAVSTHDATRVVLRGHDITALMTGRTFGQVAFLLLVGRLPTPGEAAVFEAMLVASSDHGPNPPSTSAARIIASGNRAAIEAAIAGGILAIGDVHGGAGEALMDLMAAALREHPDPRTAARQVVRSALAAGRRLPGFGHRTHTPADPRHVALFALARQHRIAGAGVAFAEAVQEELAAQGRALPINVDGAMAALLYDMGLPAHLGKVVFIIGRVAGLAAHAMEEMNRERPMRFHFPFVYDGPEG